MELKYNRGGGFVRVTKILVGSHVIPQNWLPFTQKIHILILIEETSV